jgi:hypothetical protein
MGRVWRWFRGLCWWLTLLIVFTLGLAVGATVEYNHLERYRFMSVGGDLYRVNTHGHAQRCRGTRWIDVREIE